MESAAEPAVPDWLLEAATESRRCRRCWAPQLVPAAQLALAAWLLEHAHTDPVQRAWALRTLTTSTTPSRTTTAVAGAAVLASTILPHAQQPSAVVAATSSHTSHNAA